MPREVCPAELIRHRPEVLFASDEDHFNKNLRSCQERRDRRSVRDDSGTSPTYARPSKRPSVVLPSGGAFGARAGAWGDSSRNSHGSFDSVA